MLSTLVLNYSKFNLLGKPEDSRILVLELSNRLNADLEEFQVNGLYGHNKPKEIVSLTCFTYMDDGDGDTMIVYTVLYR